MVKVDWTVEGMTCSNCALSVNKFLQKEGMQDVKVNPISGAVSFNSDHAIDEEKISKGIRNLGYRVAGVGEKAAVANGFLTNFLSTNKKRFLFTLPFTLVLMMHMLHRWLPLHWLMNPWIQLTLCLPVFITGMFFFGRSAINSIRNGMPNMDVLIALGALASFVYSLTGALLQLGEAYLFFETSASIITLIFMGNYLEESAIKSTQTALQSLVKSQKVMANMIAFDGDHQEHVFPVENSSLKTGDLVLIKNGEQVPADCRVLWGDCMVNEAIMTGESLPVAKQKKDFLVGGSVVDSGIVKAQVTAAGEETVLSGIVKMVQHAQAEKPPVQKLADRISAIFVPVVIGISIITFLLNYYVADASPGSSLMRSVAVLVISCPCALGLATPAAIAVGLGRAAKNGILFRNATGLENFKFIRQVVFDKTGTLTTGDFTVTGFETSIDEGEFKKIVYSLEKYSGHPLATSITRQWKTNDLVKWKNIEEVKGMGMKAEDRDGNLYEAGSSFILGDQASDNGHAVYITKNKQVIGWLDVSDEIRPEAKYIVGWLHSKNIKTILLSGDRTEKCRHIAAELGIDEYFAEHTPAQKLEKITNLNAASPTAMIGDGINDAPALAKATVGISLSDASQLALQSADVVLVNHGLKNLPNALSLGKHTYLTIKQNLFWAFAYNVVAIPIAAIGLLSPTVAALAMAFSDLVLAGNSLRLFAKKIL
jgi:Cu+-exporting ATPase